MHRLLLAGLMAFVMIPSVTAQESTAETDEIALFNDIDLSNWLADPQAVSHWKVIEKTLIADGKGSNLVTEQNFRNFVLMLDWRAPAGSSGGVFVRSRPKIAIVDPAMNETGSGGLSENKEGPKDPASKADKPAGEWNQFIIEIVGNKVKVTLNEQVVVDNVVMENAFDSSRRIPVNGKIELQAVGPMEFRNIKLKRLPDDASP